MRTEQTINTQLTEQEIQQQLESVFNQEHDEKPHAFRTQLENLNKDTESDEYKDAVQTFSNFANDLTCENLWSGASFTASHDELFAALYQRVKHIPKLKEILTEEFKDTISRFFIDAEFADFCSAYSSVKDIEELRVAAKDAIINIDETEIEPSENDKRIAQKFPELKGAIEAFFSTELKKALESISSNGNSQFEQLIECFSKQTFFQLRCDDPENDFFAIPTSDNTHEYTVLVRFNRATGVMQFNSGCLSRSNLPALKEHWKEHYDNQRRTRALPMVINSLKAIARGSNPKHANMVSIEDRAKTAKWAARELLSAGYQVPAFKGKMG